MTVSDNNMTVAIRLDSSVQPHVIDITGPGQTRPALGIYELDGDTLRICWATEETAARPRAFLTTATGGGKLVVLKRGDVRRAKLYYLRDRKGKAARIREKREY